VLDAKRSVARPPPAYIPGVCLLSRIAGARQRGRRSIRRAQIRKKIEAHGAGVIAFVALCALSALMVLVNLLWIYDHRRGLPFDIDEAGYLHRAIRDADALGDGGLSGLWHAFRLPDPQAPLLPITAGVLREVTHAGPVGLIAAQQLFVVALIFATFALARQLGAGIAPALVAAACAAALPGVIDGGRAFGFALPATALMTATLAAQLAAREFDRPERALVWGLLLGLTTMTRTLMLALLAAVVAAALIRLFLARARPRQWASFGLGLVVAALVASTWYTATWHLVWDYLTSYGYGVHAEDYGPPRPFLSWARWTFRTVHLVNTEVYAPLTIAALVCAAAAASRLVRRPTWLEHPRAVAAGFLRSGWGTVTFVIVVDYALLSSTRNVGSHFELPLLPACSALLVSAAATSGRIARAVALTAAAGAAAFSLVAAEGLLSGPPVRIGVKLGPFAAVAYDDRGPLVSYSTGFLPTTAAGTEPLLRRWQRSNVALANTLLEEAAKRGKPTPVVFFAVQDPFVNTNSLGLLAQERGISLPIGLLLPPEQAGESFAAQLQDPARGVPDVMIVGPASANEAAERFAPPVQMAAVRKAAKLAGFRKSGNVVLPDGRDMQLWWRSR
jgi:hypothetical protein